MTPCSLTTVERSRCLEVYYCLCSSGVTPHTSWVALLRHSPARGQHAVSTRSAHGHAATAASLARPGDPVEVAEAVEVNHPVERACDDVTPRPRVRVPTHSCGGEKRKRPHGCHGCVCHGCHAHGTCGACGCGQWCTLEGCGQAHTCSCLRVERLGACAPAGGWRTWARAALTPGPKTRRLAMFRQRPGSAS